MKGLLVKDLRIFLRMKTSLIVILVIGIFMSLNGGNPSFALGYMMVVSDMLVVNTISYDYFEKGMSFMFTLPVRRRDYVLEKYLLVFLVEIAVGIVAVVIQLVNMVITGTADWVMFWETGIGCMVAATLIMAMYIPVNLKYGPEKSRIALLIFAGGVAALSYLIYKVEAAQRGMKNLVGALDGMTSIQIVGIIVGAWVLMMLASVGISFRIMEKKEF